MSISVPSIRWQSQRLRHAIAQARQCGYLGSNVLGLGLDFDIQVKLGAGAFVCGEETALIASLEDQIGEPKTETSVSRR